MSGSDSINARLTYRDKRHWSYSLAARRQPVEAVRKSAMGAIWGLGGPELVEEISANMERVSRLAPAWLPLALFLLNSQLIDHTANTRDAPRCSQKSDTLHFVLQCTR